MLQNNHSAILNDAAAALADKATEPSMRGLGWWDQVKMLVAFGKGGKTRWITIHEVVSAIGSEKTRDILFFHAFSGCDIVSSFHE